MNGMEKKAKSASEFLKQISNPHRLLILCNLVEGEKNVSELLQKIDISQPNISNHLAKLRDDGIVDYRREHRTLYYFIKNKNILKIIETLYEIYCKK